MRFFTPQLFTRFNSSNEVEADRANENWEAALGDYRKHLAEINERLPRGAQELAELCLHDAELLSPEHTLEPVFSIPLEPFGSDVFCPAITILLLKQEHNLVSLIYVLSDRIRQHASPSNWRFSKLRIHWLYDEVDVDERQPGHFLHRVLLSDGRVLEVPFISVAIRRVPLSPSAGGKVARTSA